MTAPMHSTPEVYLEATEKGETISISVHNHLLRRRKRSLPWKAHFEVMTRRWAAMQHRRQGRVLPRHGPASIDNRECPGG